MIDGGFPVYILDDDTILFEISSKTHPDYWEDNVAGLVAEKFGVSQSAIVNLPYCQRRARVVGNVLYCGDELSRKLVGEISKAVGLKLSLKFDEHESRCPFELAAFRSLGRR